MIVEGSRVNDLRFKEDDEPIPDPSIKFTDLKTVPEESEINLAKFIKLTFATSMNQYKYPDTADLAEEEENQVQKEADTIPVILTVETHEPGFLQGHLPRVPIDLLCVVDKSGSMLFDEKMTQLKKTLKNLLKFLIPDDRLCLIEYDSKAKRLTNLRCVNEQNIEYFEEVISGIQASGGTSICDGLLIAKHVIDKRRQKNRVCSIFLLSDGDDPAGLKGMEHLLQVFQKQYNSEVSINTFGFGEDCNEDLLSVIADRCNGLFYFIETEEDLNDMFCDCLGRMVSVLGKNAKIRVQLKPTKAFPEIAFHRTYGKDWSGDSEIIREVDLGYIIAGSVKTFVFKVKLPPNKYFDGEDDFPLDLTIVEAGLTSESFLAKEESNLKLPFQTSTSLTLTLVDCIDPTLEPDEEVEVQVLRVETAEAQTEMYEMVKQKKRVQASQLHDQWMKKLAKNSKISNHPVYQGCLRNMADMSEYIQSTQNPGVKKAAAKRANLRRQKKNMLNIRNQMMCSSSGNWAVYANKRQQEFQQKMKAISKRQIGGTEEQDD